MIHQWTSWLVWQPCRRSGTENTTESRANYPSSILDGRTRGSSRNPAWSSLPKYSTSLTTNTTRSSWEGRRWKLTVSSPALGDTSRPITIQPMATSSTNSPLLLIDMVTPWSATYLSKFFKEKKITGLGRWWTGIWMIIPGVDHRPRPAKKKLKFYFSNFDSIGFSCT